MHPIKFHTCTYCGKTEAFEPDRPLYLSDWCSLLFNQYAHTKCHAIAMQQNKSPYTLRYTQDIRNSYHNMLRKVERYAKENFTCEKTIATKERKRTYKERVVTYTFTRLKEGIQES